MSNHKIIFFGSEESETQEHQLNLFANNNGNIYIGIDSKFNSVPDFICLDKATAIKLSRVLKSEISKIQ
jgi:hypothetical protein